MLPGSTVGVIRQAIHVRQQKAAVVLGEFHTQRLGQGPSQAPFPAAALVVQVGSPAGGFTGWIQTDAGGGAYESNKRPLG